MVDGFSGRLCLARRFICCIALGVIMTALLFWIDDDDDDDDDNVNDREQDKELRNKEDEDEDSASMKKSKSKKKRTKKFRKNDGDDDDDDEEEEEPTKKVKRKRSKKKVRISTTFETLGYPAGNRNYKEIPVNEFEYDNHSDDDNGRVRRSKRRKFPPLAYWKNERVLYEANTEMGVLGQAFGDMPFVSGVLTAEPTPYKKRKVARRRPLDDEDNDEELNGKSKKKKLDDDGGGNSAIMKPFDSKKLRKVG